MDLVSFIVCNAATLFSASTRDLFHAEGKIESQIEKSITCKMFGAIIVKAVLIRKCGMLSDRDSRETERE